MKPFFFFCVWMENISKHSLASCLLCHSSRLNKHVRGAKYRADRNVCIRNHLFNLFQFIYCSLGKESKHCSGHFSNIRCPCRSKQARNNMYHKRLDTHLQLAQKYFALHSASCRESTVVTAVCGSSCHQGSWRGY